MKMREPHLVPLSRQAVAILEGLLPITGSSRYVFEGVKPGLPISDNTLNKLLKTLGYEGKMTQHGWRAIARTLLDEVLEFRVDWIEHQLAHSVRDANGRAYNRTSHLEGRMRMMQVWADYLDALRDKKPWPKLEIASDPAPRLDISQRPATSPRPATKPRNKGENNFDSLIEKLMGSKSED